MEAAVRARFDDGTLRTLLAAWGFQPAAAVFLQDSFNIVYRLPAAFLRISHSSSRPPESVAAEIDWLTFLAGRGLPVCRPRRTGDGQPLALAPDGEGAFVGALFAAVPGERVGADSWNEDLFRRLGGLMGGLHQASRAYRPPAGRRRAHWHAHENSAGVAAGLAADADAAAHARLREILARMATWPTSPDTYGLIHGDIHAGNFHVHGEAIHLFDFDDSCYHWFAADVANAIYYAVWQQARYETPGADPALFAVGFARALLDGYVAVAPPPNDLAARVSDLIEYRDLLVYSYLRRRFGEAPPTPGFAALLAQRRRRFQTGDPYVAVDWEAVLAAV